MYYYSTNSFLYKTTETTTSIIRSEIMSTDLLDEDSLAYVDKVSLDNSLHVNSFFSITHSSLALDMA